MESPTEKLSAAIIEFINEEKYKMIPFEETSSKLLDILETTIMTEYPLNTALLESDVNIIITIPPSP